MKTEEEMMLAFINAISALPTEEQIQARREIEEAIQRAGVRTLNQDLTSIEQVRAAWRSTA